MIPRRLTNAAAMLTSKYDFSASSKSSAGRMWRASWSTTEAGSDMMASEVANADDCLLICLRAAPAPGSST